jgi:hypothetical protein
MRHRHPSNERGRHQIPNFGCPAAAASNPPTGQKNPGQQRHQKHNTTAKAPRDSMEYKALVPLRDKAAD